MENHVLVLLHHCADDGLPLRWVSKCFFGQSGFQTGSMSDSQSSHPDSTVQTLALFRQTAGNSRVQSDQSAHTHTV